MNKFYDRKNELKALEQIEKNSLNSANFTVITGRRRIGKTELLKKYIEGKKAAIFLQPEVQSPFCVNNGKKILKKVLALKFLEKLQSLLIFLNRLCFFQGRNILFLLLMNFRSCRI